MYRKVIYRSITFFLLLHCFTSQAQKQQLVKIVRAANENKVDIFINDRPFTTFLYPDTLEKPVLYPVYAPDEVIVTRGFPLAPRPNEPVDHPHHVGIWFNYEKVNGLDFWNNSYAIPEEKKQHYGWVQTDRILETVSGKKGILSYHANWEDQQNNILLEETTRLEFSGNEQQRTIDRVTTLTANTDVLFADSKDGLIGFRAAHELQIPTAAVKKVKDKAGNITEVKGPKDTIANGNYITAQGKTGDAAWGTRGVWCKLYGKMNNDSIGVVIIDHPKNPGYPTYWHARGYGLFAANPFGAKAFTNGTSPQSGDFKLKQGESVTFRYRILITSGTSTLTPEELNQSAKEFAQQR